MKQRTEKSSLQHSRLLNMLVTEVSSAEHTLNADEADAMVRRIYAQWLTEEPDPLFTLDEVREELLIEKTYKSHKQEGDTKNVNNTHRD